MEEERDEAIKKVGLNLAKELMGNDLKLSEMEIIGILETTKLAYFQAKLEDG